MCFELKLNNYIDIQKNTYNKNDVEVNQNTFSKKVHLSTYSQDKGLRITLPLNSIG